MVRREKKEATLYDDVAPEVRRILAENDQRHEAINVPFNPITGEASIGQRTEVTIEGFAVSRLFLPELMCAVPLVRQLIEAGSVAKFLDRMKRQHQGTDEDYAPTTDNVDRVLRYLVRVRIRYDFAFWAALFVFIKAKGGGEDVRFRLNRPQRKLVEQLEEMRLEGKPIRLVLLKARQWGGSTCIQLYMAWLQLVHGTGLNSIIVGHLSASTAEVKDMFDRMMQHYPPRDALRNR